MNYYKTSTAAKTSEEDSKTFRNLPWVRVARAALHARVKLARVDTLNAPTPYDSVKGRTYRGARSRRRQCLYRITDRLPLNRSSTYLLVAPTVENEL